MKSLLNLESSLFVFVRFWFKLYIYEYFELFFIIGADEENIDDEKTEFFYSGSIFGSVNGRTWGFVMVSCPLVFWFDSLDSLVLGDELVENGWMVWGVRNNAFPKASFIIFSVLIY